jgi:hypothetical protein
MALIDGRIARSLFGELSNLRRQLVPQIKEIVEAATQTGLSIGRETADSVLDTVESRIEQLITLVDENSPEDVKPE